MSINDSGHVAGTYAINSGSTTGAFRMRNGIVQFLGTFGGTFAQASGINNRGDVTGFYNLGAPIFGARGFRWRNGIVDTIGGSDRIYQTMSINNNGVVSGYTIPTATNKKPFTWNGTVSYLPFVDSLQQNEAAAINDSGTVIGTTGRLGSFSKATRWKGLTVETIQPSLFTQGIDLNNRGVALVRTDDFRHFLWQGTTLIDIRSLIDTTGGKRLTAVALNDSGAILGYVTNSSGTRPAVFRPRRSTSIENLHNTWPSSCSLDQNYPNPFNPSTKISYSIGRPGVVTLKVFDVLGREIAVLIAGAVDAGKHDVHWDASSVGSGVYLYELRAGGFRQVRRMMVVK